MEYDEAGSIGKRYRREDEIGTPYCITVDFETENEDKIYTTTDDGKLLTYEEIFSNAGSIIQIVENDITEEFYDEKRENL